MRKNLKKLLSVAAFCLTIYGFGQEKTIKGQVLDADGFPVHEAYVYIEGETEGVYTDENGNYTISAEKGDKILVEFVFTEVQDQIVGEANTYNFKLTAKGEITLDAVVVTALGIDRDKKALGYAVQEVDGDLLNASKSNNALSSLSGNVAGVQISTPSGNMGGSARILLRGAASVTGENKPLIVVDGIPMSNGNFNSTNTQRGGGGRDYGDLSFDIDPNNIEKVSVLKGGSATALYGSRGMNGVILITTKKGSKGRDVIEVNAGVSVENISLFPKLQNQYGGGSKSTFNTAEINGTTYNIAEYAVDESWGPKFDPNVKVLHWDNLDPEFAGDYLNARPWVAAEHGPKSFFNTGVTFNNSVSFSKSINRSVVRMNYSNLHTDGMFPNSELDKNSINIGMMTNFGDKVTLTGDLNYVNTSAFNRPEVGYGDNSVMQKMLQWGQRQLDYKRLENYKLPNGSQRTWNRSAWNEATPKYADNPYWTAYMNTAEDTRDRYFGNVKLKYKITPELYFMANVYGDGYSLKVSERVAVGSQAQSSYSEVSRTASEMNYEGRLHFDKEFGKISVNSFVGANLRDHEYSSIAGNTEGGLVVPLLYNLGNSSDKPSVSNYREESRVNSVYGMLSIGFDDIFFLEGTARNDWSSTLPKNNNSYFYPSVTGSFVFSELIDSQAISLGKIRAGWARTGNDTSPYSLINTFNVSDIFNGAPTFSLTSVNKNPDLKSETIDSWEVGLELSMFKGRLGFDVTYYDQHSYDLIMPVQTSASVGFTQTIENAAEMRNKGIEALVNMTPVKTEDFQWNLTWNFAKNENKVEKLLDGVDAINLVNAPFKVSLWAVEGMEYGQLRGSDFIYDDLGNKVVAGNGRYAESAVTELGSVLPDYNMGLRNTLRYKDLTMSFLIDMQKGGKYFSTSNMWGMYSGMLEETAANGIRENGIVLDGVTGDVKQNKDGSYTVTNTAENTKNISATTYGYNFYAGPMAQNVFDADYFKLREVTLSYSLPEKLRGPFSGAELSVFGRNLLIWGLDNDNFDPEMTTSGSGNIQGIEGGSLPATRTYGMNLKLKF